jgi:surfeit locus 1 family protein
VGAVALIALTLALGRWQTHRAEEKQALQALFEARIAEPPVTLTGSLDSAEPLLYRRVRAAGEWMAQGQIFIDNQVLQGRAGFQVVTPLKLAGKGDAVLVNRGWVARGAQYPLPPVVDVPAGRVEVSGMASLPPKRFLELATDTVQGNVWQNLSLERFRRQTGIAILPVVVLSDRATPGLAPVRDKPDAGVARHQEYALTWFSLAATALVLWLALNLKKNG